MKESDVYTPEFIPYYPSITKRFSLSYFESLLYGYIRFYTLSVRNNFYFKNNQIGALLSRENDDKISERQVSRAIQRLIDLGLIKATYSNKNSGGRIRSLKAVKAK